ncbi:hypothetical protein [Bifidobacterium merycicum]|uniref:hypothetical protein n=1 Tax=Bifidobacterium merycicum TaxID=78345 RepID=UPI001F32688B|nr:hypothetical protein [Bifidobacterium merycicum]
MPAAYIIAQAGCWIAADGMPFSAFGAVAAPGVPSDAPLGVPLSGKTVCLRNSDWQSLHNISSGLSQPAHPLGRMSPSMPRQNVWGAD